MSAKAVKKEPQKKLSDADNPSLIKAGDEIHLRVLDDFFVEQSLPKWVHHRKEWELLKEELKTKYPEDKIRDLEDPKKQKEYTARLNKLKQGDAKLNDDRWNIRDKHEKSVKEGIEKSILFFRKEGFLDKMKSKLGFVKKPIPVEVAFEDLKEHLIHISTEEMADKTARVKLLEHKFRESGQYAKADKIRAYLESMVFDDALVKAGFTDYVTEDQMIRFIKESEQGVMVDFLRYYDDPIPEAVLEKKKKADSLMVFDNYVVAYYSDIEKMTKKAAETKKEKKHEEAKKAVERRRDPILFGVIKESRKLYYVADWVTETDDLTLELLESILGETRHSVKTDSYESQLLGDTNNSMILSGGDSREVGGSFYSRNTIHNYDIEDGTRTFTYTDYVNPRPGTSTVI